MVPRASDEAAVVQGPATGDAMKIRCDACGAQYNVADQKVAGRTLRVRCRACNNNISVSGHAAAPAPRQEGSGLIDIRAMAAVMDRGRPAPGPADEVALSAQPSLPTALPTAGVIMPVVKADRPWWLVPSLALGGALLITVVALLAVLMLQPTDSNRRPNSDSLPGAAASTGKAPAGPASTATPSFAQPAPTPVTPRSIRSMKAAPCEGPHCEQTTPAARPQKRRVPRKARSHKRPSRKAPKAVARTQPKHKTSPRAEPRTGPRSISEILMNVGTINKAKPKAKPGPALPAKLGFRDIRRAVSGRLGAAKACGKRFSTRGKVVVRLVVSGATGSVLSVSAKGTHAGSPTGRCISRALRSTKFKRFSSSRQSVYYTVFLR